jgi:serine/threonine protein phosphatase PrpC
MLFRLGKILNYGSASSGGFDALSINESAKVFVLADGANSSPVGGRASQLAVDTVANEIGLNPGMSPSMAFDKAHQKIKEELITPTGTTCLSISATDRLSVGSCGDSLAEIYMHHTLWGWRLSWHSQLDLLQGTNNPSQLMGSDVYYGAAETVIQIKRKTLILMMTDGMYKFTSLKDRKKLISTISRDVPSDFDLEYLINCIAERAKNNRSGDDISGILIWLDPYKNV